LVFAAVAAVATVTGGCAASAADSRTPAPAAAPELSAEDLFTASCAQFDQDDAVDALFSGLDHAGIERVNKALALAQQAGAEDPDRYGVYAAEFQAFAEGMGNLVAVSNDPTSTYHDINRAVRRVDFPNGGVDCPETPDSGGLPLPSSS
jgi:hypothetical protein